MTALLKGGYFAVILRKITIEIFYIICYNDYV